MSCHVQPDFQDKVGVWVEKGNKTKKYEAIKADKLSGLIHKMIFTSVPYK